MKARPSYNPSRGLLCDCKTSQNLRKGWFEALVRSAVLVLITAMITGSAGAGPHKVRAGLGSIVGNGTRCYKVKPATHFIGSRSLYNKSRSLK